MQDSQTSTLRGCAGLMAWRGIELQGSQIFCEGGNGVHAIGKGIELQGAQTRAATDLLVLEKKKLHGTQTRRVDYRVRRR